jgi:hypothetical protein
MICLGLTIRDPTMMFKLSPHNNVSSTTNVRNNAVLGIVKCFEGVAVFSLKLHASRSSVIIDTAEPPPFL